MDKSNAEDEVALVYRSPLGPLKLVANPDGICSVKWLFGKHREEPEGDAGQESHVKGSAPNGLQDTPDTSEKSASGHLKVCTTWLDAYFNSSLLKDDPPRPPLVFPTKAGKGTFFHSVWCTLASTGVGERLSYKELARLSGHPQASRAVGQAMKKHCLPILVPCHRVVKSGSGDVGNYSGGEGTATKKWLLEHERKMITSNS